MLSVCPSGVVMFIVMGIVMENVACWVRPSFRSNTISPSPVPSVNAIVTGIGKAGSTGAGSFTVNTSGSDIANPDSFHFVYQPITGDTTIVARIAGLGTTDNAAKAGITAVIQPGGSMRDQEVIDAADEAGIAMVFTAMRHFRH